MWRVGAEERDSCINEIEFSYAVGVDEYSEPRALSVHSHEVMNQRGTSKLVSATAMANSCMISSKSFLSLNSQNQESKDEISGRAISGAQIDRGPGTLKSPRYIVIDLSRKLILFVRRNAQKRISPNI